MKTRRAKWRREVVPMDVLVCFTSMLLFLSACAFLSSEMRRGCSTTDSNSQVVLPARWQRQLRAGGGAGSYPPQCMAKCGDCNPCYPVHVPVPPGTPVTAEYYPEAWRCKCGNQLFMP